MHPRVNKIASVSIWTDNKRRYWILERIATACVAETLLRLSTIRVWSQRPGEVASTPFWLPLNAGCMPDGQTNYFRDTVKLLVSPLPKHCVCLRWRRARVDIGFFSPSDSITASRQVVGCPVVSPAKRVRGGSWTFGRNYTRHLGCRENGLRRMRNLRQLAQFLARRVNDFLGYWPLPRNKLAKLNRSVPFRYGTPFVMQLWMYIYIFIG
jgi:hypothetical protein